MVEIFNSTPYRKTETGARETKREYGAWEISIYTQGNGERCTKEDKHG